MTSRKELDRPIITNGQEYSFREFLLTLNVPGQSKADGSPRPAFHSVDRSCQGKDSGKAVYLTTYVDITSYAESLVGVLPALVNAVLDKQVAFSWFHVDALDATNDVTLQYTAHSHSRLRVPDGTEP
jgi:hypothetical protein